MKPAFTAFLLFALFGVLYLHAQPVPTLPVESGEVVVESEATNEPIKTWLGWDADTNATAWTAAVGGITNRTTTNTVSVTTPPGTNRLELRTYYGTNSSQPLITHIVVAVNTYIDHWPETAATPTGPWTRRQYGTLTNPPGPFGVLRTGQSKLVQTNRGLLP